MRRSFMVLVIGLLLLAVVGCVAKPVPAPQQQKIPEEQPTTPEMPEIKNATTPDLIFMAGNPPKDYVHWTNPEQKMNIVNLKGDLITVYRFKGTNAKPVRYAALDTKTRSKLITRPVDIEEKDYLKIVCKFHYCTTMVYFE